LKFWIATVGHRMSAWGRAGYEDYVRRMPRETRIALVEIKPERGTADAAPRLRARAREAEHRRIVAALPADCRRVVLDERGVSLTTRALAARIAAWRAGGRDVAFIIGGADGTAAGLKEEAELLWSLTPLTLPHQLVRVILVEQLYRAASILGGHPYHRE
jgi:23S rRNA (pseudouridine1915-N3)-methyltransferase